MDREAYPQNYGFRTALPAYDTKKWKALAIKVGIAVRKYRGEHTEADIVAHFTGDWEREERDDFKSWLKYQQKNKTRISYPKYSKKEKRMQKVAYDFGSGQKDEQLKELKKKLRSRINSAERLLTNIMDEDLLEDPSKGVYMGRILQKLKEEVSVMRRPQLMTARHNRAKKILTKAGFSEGVELLDQNIELIEASQIPCMIKIADTDVSAIMTALKGEIDAFNYGKHLSSLYEIAQSLKNAGRHSEADQVITVIKKDLADIDSIHKKLVEVYTALGSIPSEPRRQPAEPELEQAPRGY